MKFRLDIDWSYIGMILDVALLPSGHTEYTRNARISYNNDKFNDLSDGVV